MAWSPKTLQQLRDEVFGSLRDSDRVFITDALVNTWLNEAYFDLCTRLRIPESSTTGTTSSSGTITLPSGFIEVKDLIIDGARPAWVPSDTFLSYKVPGESTPNDVTLYRIFNNTVETYPVANQKSYTLEYIDSPAAVTSDSSTFSALPAELHIRLVYFALHRAKLTEGELTEAAYYQQQYERGLPDMPRAAWRRFPGGITITPAPNIFQGEWVD